MNELGRIKWGDKNLQEEGYAIGNLGMILCGLGETERAIPYYEAYFELA